MKLRIITKNRQSIQLFNYKLTSAVELTVTEPCVAWTVEVAVERLAWDVGA